MREGGTETSFASPGRQCSNGGGWNRDGQSPVVLAERRGAVAAR